MMESSKQNHLANGDSREILPPLLKAIGSHQMAGFDSVKVHGDAKGKPAGVHPLSIPVSGALEVQNDFSKTPIVHSISISMPPSPIETHMPNTKRVLFKNDHSVMGEDAPNATAANGDANSQKKKAKFYSQPMPKGPIMLNEATIGGNFPNKPRPLRNPHMDRLKDNRFDSFKTWSGKLERQLTNLRGKHHEPDPESQTQQPAPAEVETLPVDRYFDALEGPELETLRASEEIILPADEKWPFLLRFPVSSFGICLGVGSQAIMWKTLATTESTQFLRVSPDVNLVLWLIAIALVLIVAFIYTLKMIFYFEAVRREYYHPIRVNFFFAPWIALLFLALGAPPSITQKLHASLWYVLMTPIFLLELKIYGQWMSGGQRRLSKVANPSNHLSIVGNFVGALLGATMGLKEGPIFFFAVGLAHYTVLFVTLYQRLPTNETLPKELHPVFFLFVAAPSVASMAWAKIQGSFDYGSRIAYFIALFLYFSLAVRVNFFRGFRFSLAWWAYTFPMTGAAIATIRYSTVVTSVLTKILTVALCITATLTVAALLVTTIIHAFILRDLFPNDIAIAISDRKPKTTRKWYHRRSGSADNIIEKFLKYTSSDAKDIESSVSPPSVNDQELPSVSSVPKDFKSYNI